MSRILVIEDDPSIRLGLEDTLRAKGYVVEVATRGERGIELAESFAPDLIVLDIMLPDTTGFDVCRTLRSTKSPARDVPIIILSARGAELDRVRGLELGADDYVTKPFSLMELLARVKVVLKRVGKGKGGDPLALAFGDVEVDFATQRVLKAGSAVELPSRAFAILKVFARRPGEVITREDLLSEAWGYEKIPNTRTVDNHLVKLRKALEDEPEKPIHLVTVHGAGYRLEGAK